ncbi:hypothetical protein ACFC18_48600, partial [Streptomyces sp. NPDC056121]
FIESDHYLHVYANYSTEPGEPDRAEGRRRQGPTPMAAFLRASPDEEQLLRSEFARVHVCRRFAPTLWANRMPDAYVSGGSRAGAPCLLRLILS